MLGILCLLFFSACDSRDRRAVDELNDISYAYHYTNLDSTLHYARLAYDLAGDNYPSGQAEALNNQAFVDIAKMDYDCARECLGRAAEASDNQIEILVADVQQMRLCQRVSSNREYYEFREKALKRMQRINEERDALPERLYRRLVYAETEFAIINSTYYYYVGMEQQSADALLAIDPHGPILSDTAQYLNYLYNIGAGGIISNLSAEATREKEIEYLYRCLTLARENGCVYFEANAMMAMADMGLGTELAGNALMIFNDYGDPYQTAAAHRSLAACYGADGRTDMAFDHLDKALSDTIIFQAPDLVASIYAQLASVYRVANDSVEAEKYAVAAKNIQDDTRRDRYFEARAGILDKSLHTLNALIVGIMIIIFLLIVALRIFYRLNKKQEAAFNNDELLAPLRRWQEKSLQLMEQQNEYREEIDERRAVTQNSMLREGRTQMEHRSRLALVNSALPFVDRIINEVDMLMNRTNEDHSTVSRRYEYVGELSDKINDYNDVLTDWIRMDRGALSLRIETFALNDVFRMVEHSKPMFDSKGISLEIDKTDALVKADKTLTLFMINTIADNARKNTPEGGRVCVSATNKDSFVEISIEDNGCGMSKEKLNSIFSRTNFDDHGFGLINCRGIIDKYRKTSRIFDVCHIAAKSEEGRGSRFYFTLPKGIKGKILSLLLMFVPMAGMAVSSDTIVEDVNIVTVVNTSDDSLVDDISADNTLAEYCRVMQQAETDRTIAVVILVLLLLFILPAYYVLYYRKRLYFRFCVSRVETINAILLDDITIKEKLERIKPLVQDEYPDELKTIVNNIVSTLEETESQLTNERISTEMAEDELHRLELEYSNLHVSNLVLDNCFSSLKHETMYYPTRIRRMIDDIQSAAQPDTKQLLADLNATTRYYRDLYFMLSQQARQQVEKNKMMVKAVNVKDNIQGAADNLYILGNQNMLDYLFEILRGMSPEWTIAAEEKNNAYIVITVPTTATDEDIFTPSKENIPYLICRQIVRDHAEATNRFGCGMVVKDGKEQRFIEITLPRARHIA